MHAGGHTCGDQVASGACWGAHMWGSGDVRCMLGAHMWGSGDIRCMLGAHMWEHQVHVGGHTCRDQVTSGACWGAHCCTSVTQNVTTT